MLKYLIVRRNLGEIEFKLLDFPIELEEFLRKEKVFLTKNDIILGIIGKSLYVDNIRGSNAIGVSIKIPLAQPNKEETELIDGISRPCVKFRDSYDGRLMTEALVIALNQLCTKAFDREMLIQLSAPYALERVPLTLT